jgi:hypothetical protein
MEERKGERRENFRRNEESKQEASATASPSCAARVIQDEYVNYGLQYIK